MQRVYDGQRTGTIFDGLGMSIVALAIAFALCLCLAPAASAIMSTDTQVADAQATEVADGADEAADESEAALDDAEGPAAGCAEEDDQDSASKPTFQAASWR